ncbi:Clp protease N-terminal domain-containing protein [Hymenobacter yonginensis]|uniref:Clp protease N-terminal domain-containing protein n=1 Tax=Hymenobacter yonginensis TaxID=748197 RepID=A0ABY7PKA3_9BACT|nr:Clp protease N-terminal domain-containing protein [Hymenobacter yonginensis]WBO83690.1 Clp protease N-terminal domain-containing protein [Hymenobacter yonginensis]
MFSWWKSQRELPFSDSLKHVIRRSREEALRLYNDYIGPEHLLLAILAEPTGRGALLSADFGLTFDVLLARLPEPGRPGR